LRRSDYTLLTTLTRVKVWRLQRCPSLRVLQVETAKYAAFVGDLAFTGCIRLEEIDGFHAQGFCATAPAKDPLSAGQLHFPAESRVLDSGFNCPIAKSALGDDVAVRVIGRGDGERRMGRDEERKTGARQGDTGKEPIHCNAEPLLRQATPSGGACDVSWRGKAPCRAASPSLPRARAARCY
jgi:hypothetical protein